jgi:hypothetical protein
MQIQIHLDQDTLHYAGPCDVGASLRELASRITDALSAAYPSADVDVTYSSDTGGGGRTVVTDDDGRPAPCHVSDDVRHVSGTAWEPHDWIVPAAQ